MIITAIAAMDQAGLIGDGTAMPWHLPLDLKRFRKLTLGKPVILGRKTLDSLGKPLPGRPNIVLTKNETLAIPGCQVAGSIEQALELAQGHLVAGNRQEVMIIGGGMVYERTMPRWDRLLLTVVDGEFTGDTYFPIAPARQARWLLTEEEFYAADAKNPHAHWFLALNRQGDAEPTDQDFDLAGWLAQCSVGAGGLR